MSWTTAFPVGPANISEKTMRRYVVKGTAFVLVGFATFVLLVILALTNIWDVSKPGSFVLPAVTGLMAALGVGKNER